MDKLKSGILIGKRLFSSVKRKYPINPDEAKTLPVFQYAVSKPNYQRVFVWGYICSGALGIPFIKSGKPLPKVEAIKFPKRLHFAEVFEVKTAACGYGFTAFSVNGETKLYGTGLNTYSQIGYHTSRNKKPYEILFYPQPINLPFKNAENAKIIKLAAGRAHLMVLSNEGLYLLGDNTQGQCGRFIVEDEDYINSNHIQHIPTIEGKQIVNIETSPDTSFAITEDGAVYSCGFGLQGQTGLGNFNNSTCEFLRVGGDIQSEKIVKISSRCGFVMALNDKGDVFGWGNADCGQMVSSTNPNQEFFNQPSYLSQLQTVGRITDIASGAANCLVLNDKHEVYVWGMGLLGLGPNMDNSKLPIKIPETLFGRNYFQMDNVVEKINCGFNHSIAITNLGDIYIWGRNKMGCLGLGDLKDQYFPLKVALGGYAKEVFCGYDHTIAICKPFI